MNKGKKLKKVIKYAVDNGYKGNYITTFKDGLQVIHCDPVELLFSHDFAKAVFGEHKLKRGIPDYYKGWANWAYHLQQAVISEDPIEYYWDYIVDLT